MKKKKSSPSKMKQKTTARTVPEETPINPLEESNQDELHNTHGFYACYLLTSLCPRFKGHTYLGFTVNPRRRIRQHNGEIRSGAFRTKKRRPWEMVFCIYGFPSNISALQFEWAWQHPTESLQVRQAAATFKSFSGVANKIKLAYTMLNLPAWKSLNITVNYFSTKYSNHSAACPSLPEHMKVQLLPMDELPCYTETGESSLQCEDEEIDNGESESTLTDLQACFTDEFRSSCCGEKSYSSKEDEAYNKDSHGRVKLDEISRENFRCFDEFRSSSSEGDEAYNEDSHKRPEFDKMDEIPDEMTGWFEEFNNKQQCLRSGISAEYSSILKADYNCRVRIESSVFKTFSLDIGDRDEEHLSEKSDGGAKTSDEIEVIDLLSPSPECRVVTGRKKRRLATAFPVIIDLT